MNLTTAVVVIDVQQALCKGPYQTFEAERVIDTINRVTDKARADGIPVFFVQHESDTGPLMRGSEGWALAEDLHCSEEDTYIFKRYSDAFKDTALQTTCDEQGIGHLILCGMQSEFCVDSTTRQALARGFAVTVIADGHTTIDSTVLPARKISAHHNATWQNLTSYSNTAQVVNASELEI